MGCLFVVFAGMFPRFADIILWIARPNMFLAPFDGNWFWPLLGIIFLPFTTLMYVIMWTPVVGLTRLRLVLDGAGRAAGHLARHRKWLRQPRPRSGLCARLDRRLARPSWPRRWHSVSIWLPLPVDVPGSWSAARHIEAHRARCRLVGSMSLCGVRAPPPCRRESGHDTQEPRRPYGRHVA